MAGFDFMSIFDTIKHIAWMAIEIPFRIWLSTPKAFRYGVFFMILALSVFMLYLAWKNRNEWRRRYVT